jgi:hypothetical protein
MASKAETGPINPSLGMTKEQYTKAVIAISLATGLIAGAIFSQLPAEPHQPGGTGNIPSAPVR